MKSRKVRAVYAPRFDRVVVTNGRTILQFPRGDAADIAAAILAAAAVPDRAARLIEEGSARA